MGRGCYALHFATFVSQADEITTSVIQYSDCDLSHWSWFGIEKPHPISSSVHSFRTFSWSSQKVRETLFQPVVH
jgi:hypothetical protein